MITDVLRQPVKSRPLFRVNGIVPMINNLPFFKDRGLKDAAIADTLSLMTYKEVKKDEFAIEYGSAGDEFYLILEGECEVLVPNQHAIDEFKQINFEIRIKREQLDTMVDEVKMIQDYQT